jgi:hypothetical protein
MFILTSSSAVHLVMQDWRHRKVIQVEIFGSIQERSTSNLFVHVHIQLENTTLLIRHRSVLHLPFMLCLCIWQWRIYTVLVPSNWLHVGARSVVEMDQKMNNLKTHVAVLDLYLPVYTTALCERLKCFLVSVHEIPFCTVAVTER